MASVGTLSVNVVARTGMFRAGLQGASRDVTMFTGVVNKSMGVLRPFSSMFGMGIGFGATAGFIAMGRAANSFAGEMNKSLAITKGVNAEMRADMERTAHEVAYNTQYAAKEAARAYFYLASAGMDAKASIAALQQVAYFGQAGNFDLATATDLATDAQSALGLRSADATVNLKNLTHVTDVLTRANTLGNASIQQFSESLTNQAGPAFKMYGIDMEAGIAMLAAFADQGVKGAEAGTRAAIVLRDMATKSLENAEAFEKLGISVWEFGEMRDPSAIFKDMEKAMASMSGQEKQSALMRAGFTTKTVSATQSLLSYGQFMQDAEEKTRQTGITAKNVAEKNLTPLDKSWNRISASLGFASAEVFPPILSQFSTLIDKLGGASDGFDKLAASQSRWNELGKDTAWWMQSFSDLATVADAPAKYIRGTLDYLWENLKAAMFSDEATGMEVVARENAKFVKDTLGWYDKLIGKIHLVEGISQEQWRKQRNPSGMDQGVPTGIWKAQRELAKQRKAGVEEFTDKLPANITLGTRNLAGMPQWVGALKMGLDNIADTVGKKIPLSWTKATEAEQRWFSETRTPLEKYQLGLESLAEMLDILGESFEDTAKRAALLLSKDFAGALDRPQTQEPTFAPAMRQGSLEAYQTFIRNAYPVQMEEPLKETAEGVKKMAALFPRLLQDADEITRKITKPGTVETR